MCNIFCHGEDIILDEFLKVDHKVIHKQALKKIKVMVLKT